MIERRALLGGAAAVAAAALAPRGLAASMIPPKPIPVTGMEMIAIRGGYKVWTRRVGDAPIKVLLLHGGPGFSHDYLECFESFLPQNGIEFYYYDQLGCGNSDRPDDPKLWTLPRYLAEVEEVRQGLGLDNFILYGHSWGGMLAIEYALKYPQHLSRLVISNMTASVPSYVMYATVIRSQLSRTDQATLSKYEALNKTDDPAYQAVINKVYAQHVLRMAKWPEPVTRTFARANLAIYNQMQGPNEFVITGNLKNWDRWPQLRDIATPTLVMGARYDEMDPAQIAHEAKLIPDAKLWVSERGSHLDMWDDQQAYFARLIPFLQGKG
jgi:proline iminopeptidase